MIDGLRVADRLSRSLAYDILCRRDRLSGWKPHRAAFLSSIRRDRASLARSAEDRLRRIVHHAYESSPYYRDAWNAIGFSPSPSFAADDLQKLPFLTKDILREHKASLVSQRYRIDALEVSYTGGTTGTQTSFYLDHACAISHVGRQWGMLELCGYRPGMRRALVWGVHEDLMPQSVHGSFKRWFRRYASSQEALCCTVMNEPAMMDYHRKFLRFRPQVLYGYPSALTQLGRFIEQRGLEPIRVDTTITTAERLAAANRRQLIRMYGGEVFNLYSTREHGCIGFECRRHQGLHIDSEAVFLEIVKDGRRVEDGQPGEIVITDLLNYGMPFVRSRTGDVGVRSPQPCACGSPLPLLQGLDGRTSELIHRPDGSVVPGLMLTDLFMELPAIRFAQFVQESVNELDVFLVVTDDFSDSTETEVIREVRGLVGREIAVNVRRVPEIERNPRSGKFQEIISKLKRPQDGASA